MSSIKRIVRNSNTAPFSAFTHADTKLYYALRVKAVKDNPITIINLQSCSTAYRYKFKKVTIIEIIPNINHFMLPLFLNIDIKVQTVPLHLFGSLMNPLKS